MTGNLTPEYVETAKVLCRWVGLEHSISLHQGSALAMPFADHAFDRAYMLDVGMNIDDKENSVRRLAVFCDRTHFSGSMTS